MSEPFRIDDAAATHVGEVRQENEDSHLALSADRVWVVADGMGGHENGKYASQAIVDAVAAASFPEGLEQACDALSAAIHGANAEIFARSREAQAQMGSTFVALVVRGAEFVVLWSGDSRAYVFRAGQLYRLTADHTQVQAMIDRGLLTSEEALTHPMRHVLARAVGVEETLQIDAVRDAIDPRDVFLLCSDGLHGLLSDMEIAAILERGGVAAGDELIAQCLARGAPDNVTVTLDMASEPTMLVLGSEA